MANLNIKFNNKSYSIDPASLADATARLEAHLMSMMEENPDVGNVITWDGNIEGRENFDAMPDMPNYYMLYKVSDNIMPIENVVGGTFVSADLDGVTLGSTAITDTMVKDYAGSGYFTIGLISIFVVYDDSNIIGVTPGVYFMKVDVEGSSDNGYTSSLTLPSTPVAL